MPTGWKHVSYRAGILPDVSAYTNIEKMLDKYEVNIVKAFGIGGCLGFNAVLSGYCNQIYVDGNRTCVHVDDGNFYMSTGFTPYSGDYLSFYQVYVCCISSVTDMGGINHLFGDMKESEGSSNKAAVYVPIRFYKPIQ